MVQLIYSPREAALPLLYPAPPVPA